jgi:hypothetical protein
MIFQWNCYLKVYTLSICYTIEGNTTITQTRFCNSKRLSLFTNGLAVTICAFWDFRV